MDINSIKKLITLLEENNLKKLHLREGDFEIAIEKQDSHPEKVVHEHKKPHKYIEEVKQSIVEDHHLIKSPMVGTFYASAAPDQPLFIKVGDRVNEDSVVCIIEAMKVMNEVKAGVSGEIVEVLAKNAATVEFGSNLFRIKP